MSAPATVAAFFLCALASACGDSGPAAAVCGDGVAAGLEDCDGADLRGRSCGTLGFNSGALACRAACVLDLSACAVVELCANGRDDDGDGDKDCDDADCASTPACAVCGDGSIEPGEECEDGNLVAGDCCAACHAEAGCEVESNDADAQAVELGQGGERRGSIAPAGDLDVYRVEVPAGSTGTLLAETSAFLDGGSCFPATDTRLEVADGAGRVIASDEDSGEAICSRVRVAGLAPGTTVVRVAASPFSPDTVFAYRLSVAVALAPCGDRVAQEGQECDDGNVTGGDGCSAACHLEDRAEAEPDDEPGMAAGPFAPPFSVAGEVGPPGPSGFDADWLAVDLAAPARLTVETTVVGVADCRDLLAAPALYDATGGRLLQAATLDGLAATSCGRVASAPLPSGRYLVLVEGRPAPARYRLVVTAAP